MSLGLYASDARWLRMMIFGLKYVAEGTEIFILEVIKLVLWRLECKTHLQEKKPSLGLFWWRIAKFPVWPMIQWHQKFFCADKNCGITCSNIHMFNNAIKRRDHDWQYHPQVQIRLKIVVQWGLKAPQLKRSSASAVFCRYISIRLMQCKPSSFIVRILF